MRQGEMLLPEFDHEMAGTRKVLARVPFERAEWTPHPKSFTLGRLANHIGRIPNWGFVAMTESEFDFANPAPVAPPAATTADLLALFDEKVAAARAEIAAASDVAMAEPWTLRNGEHVLFTLPRAVVLRNLVFNHAVHHRGQLTVYLRLLDVPIPGLYGPSADEA